MKITKTQLKQIIKEELAGVLSEEGLDDRAMEWHEIIQSNEPGSNIVADAARIYSLISDQDFKDIEAHTAIQGAGALADRMALYGQAADHYAIMGDTEKSQELENHARALKQAYVYKFGTRETGELSQGLDQLLNMPIEKHYTPDEVEVQGPGTFYK